MKKKYLFYLLIIVAMHYEVGRIISYNQQADSDEASYQHETNFRTKSHRHLRWMAQPEGHTVKLNDSNKRKLVKYKITSANPFFSL